MKKLSIIGIIISIIIISVYSFFYLHSKDKIDKDITIKLEQPEFFIQDVTVDNLYAALIYYDLKHPEIIVAQAILETGNFKSKVFKEKNNLFGLYNSRTKNYYKFNHWTESIVGYKSYIQYKYNAEKYKKYKPPENYFNFLKDIGYAEDPKYEYKIKKILKDERYLIKKDSSINKK